ncbi:MAG: hypothetical protein ACPLRA_01205 [Candidatus Saccharicenans sp.]
MRKINYQKITALGLCLLILNFFSCSPQPKIPVAGLAKGQDMLTLLPAETSAFIVIDWNQVINLKFIQKTIEDQKDIQAYQKKLESFINLKNDVYFIAVAVAGEMKKVPGNLFMLVNLKYQKEKLIPTETEKESSLEYYEGIPFFPLIEIGEANIVCLAFLDSSNLAIGSEKTIKKVIEVYKGKSPNLLTNKDLKFYLKDINLKALSFSLFSIPADQLKAEINQNPYLKLMENVRYISSFSDYRQNAFLTEIKIYASQKEQHRKIAETLAGLKALGVGLSAQTPEISQALESMEITSSDRYVKVFINLKEDLLEKIKKAIKERPQDFLPARKKTATV